MIFTMTQNMEIYIHVYIFVLFCFIVKIALEAHGSQLRILNSRTGLPTPRYARKRTFGAINLCMKADIWDAHIVQGIAVVNLATIECIVVGSPAG